MDEDNHSPEAFDAWLSEVAKELGLTAERILERAQEEPYTAFCLDDEPKEYAEHFRLEAQQLGIQDDEDIDDFKKMGLLLG